MRCIVPFKYNNNKNKPVYEDPVRENATIIYANSKGCMVLRDGDDYAALIPWRDIKFISLTSN